MSRQNKASEADFDALVERLQEESFNDAREAYGEIGFERWRNPQFNGPIEDADSQLALTGKCGDTIELFLKFEGQKVSKASYRTNGCASSQLAGSFTAELAHGCTPEGLFELTPDDVLKKIGKLPDHDQHCTELAIQVLHECANQYLVQTTGKE